MNNVNKEDYLRVSTILSPFSGLQNVHPDVLKYAADRGTKVHKICEGIIQGFGEIGVDEETWGYVESFKKWWQEGKPIIELEKRFFCDEQRLTGQVDIIIETPEGFAIVDLKTSSKPSKTWQVQGEAYYYLAEKYGLKIKKIMFVHLNKHGKTPKILEYPIGTMLFFSVLQVYKHFFHKEKV